MRPAPDAPGEEPTALDEAGSVDPAPEVASRWAPHSDLDVVAVVLLTGLVLSGLWPVFAGWQWLVVGLVGVVIGVGWALLLIQLKQGMDLILETLAVPYLLTAGGVALGIGGRWMLPDLDTVGQVMAGTAVSWRRLAETAPPVDSEGIVLLVPFALALFVSGAATGIALRSRRPAFPLVPLLVMLGVVQVLGLHDPLQVLLPALGFAAVALAWVAHRGNRVDETTPHHNPAAVGFSFRRVMARGVVILVAVAVVTPMVEGTQGIDRWLVREALTPYDSASVTTPLSEFRRFRDGSPHSVSRTKLFTVDGVRPGTPVRLAVLDTYDGERWMASSDTGRDDPLDRFLRVPSEMDNPAKGRRAAPIIEMLIDWDLHWLPVLGRVRSFHFRGENAEARQEELRYNRSTSTALMPGGMFGGEAYGLDTVLPNDRLRPGMNPWPERNEELWEAAEFLDAPVREWSQGARRPMDALFQVARELRVRGRYSDGAQGWERQFRAGHDVERLDKEFVRGSMQVGNDEQYAATMALMANRLEIPARIVVGAPVRPAGHVKGKHVRAWVEVRIANGSWRSLPTELFMSRRPPEREGEQPNTLTPQAPRIRPPQQPQTLQRQQQQERKEQTEEKEREKKKEQRKKRRRRWWLLLLLLPTIPPAAKAVRRRRRRQAPLVSRRFTGAWDEVLDTARDLGLGVATGTRGQQALALALPGALARRVDVAAFSADQPAPDDAENCWVDCRTVEADLRERVPRWRQVLALLNPASLLPRQR